MQTMILATSSRSSFRSTLSHAPRLNNVNRYTKSQQRTLSDITRHNLFKSQMWVCSGRRIITAITPHYILYAISLRRESAELGIDCVQLQISDLSLDGLRIIQFGGGRRSLYLTLKSRMASGSLTRF